MFRKLRCRLGLHNPPTDKAFSCMGGVFVGGPCTQCNDPIVRENRFLGNAWDFGGSTEKDEGTAVLQVSPAGLLEALQQRGLTYIGDYPA
jgi:hypothetical protein